MYCFLKTWTRTTWLDCWWWRRRQQSQIWLLQVPWTMFFCVCNKCHKEKVKFITITITNSFITEKASVTAHHTLATWEVSAYCFLNSANKSEVTQLVRHSLYFHSLLTNIVIKNLYENFVLLFLGMKVCSIPNWNFLFLPHLRTTSVKSPQLEMTAFTITTMPGCKLECCLWILWMP